ncbi:MAG: methylamine utilization protein [Deltaproteobacteria bacterium]|nr:methylamine utilization protein [Deltaproteobacteria bacterium]
MAIVMHVVYPLLLGLILCASMFSPLLVVAGELANGIVKGVITLRGRPTSDAVVSVGGMPQADVKSQIARAVMDQRDVKFIPRVLAILAGTTVDFPNNDKTFHNAFSPSESKRFDLGLYAPQKSRSVRFENPGVLRILCNVHPNMEAFIVVKDHPYFAVPDGRGNYRINNVSLGKHQLEVWHPEHGMKTASFNLAYAGEVLGIDFELRTGR